MLPASADILFAVASQTITHDSVHGRPSSVTDVQVWEDLLGDEAQEETATTGSASIESYSTTINAASGYGQTNPNKAFVASSSGAAVGRHYLVTNAALGQSEWIDVVGVASDHLLARAPLSHSYANADTLVSTRMSIVIDTTWASDKTNLSDPYCARSRYRAVWTFVVAGKTYREATYFDLLRYPTTFGVTALDVDRESPGWLERLPVDYQAGQGTGLIAQAARQVKRDLSRAGRTDWAQRNSEQFNDLICMQAVVQGAHAAFMHGGGASREQLKEARDDYAQWFDQWVNNAQTPEAADASGAVAVPQRRAEVFVR